MAVHEGDGAVAGDVAELGGPLGTTPRSRRADDGRGQQVLGLVLEPGDQREQLGLVDAVDDDVGDLRLALGQGAGLVHDDGVDAGRGLEGGGVLDQHAALGAQPGADHDRGRGGQPEGVGAGDDDDGDGEQQAVSTPAPDHSHAPKVSRPPMRATSTSQNAGRSARRCPGALEFWASCTSSTICASAVSEPTLVARTRSVPVVLIDAPITAEPVLFATGRLSPVTIDSSTSEAPSSTIPSRHLPAGSDEEEVADLDLGGGDLDRTPSRRTVAMGGARSISARTASFAPPRARISNQ